MKLIAVDLDGTLLNHQKQVLENSRASINRLSAQGVHVVVSSGRCFPEVQRFVKHTACDDLVICDGGAAIMNRKNGQVLRQWTLDRDAAVQAATIGVQHGLATFAYVNHKLWINTDDYHNTFGHLPGFLDKNSLDDVMKLVDDLPAALAREGEDITKVMCWSLDAEQKRQAREQIAKIPNIDFTTSGPDNFEVLTVGAGKGTALKWLAAHLEIPMEQTAAIGDAENDIDMFRAAQYGIAMGNGADCAKAHADFVTGDCETNGIVRAFDWIMQQNKTSGLE